MGGSNEVRMELEFADPFYELILFKYIGKFFRKIYIVTDRLREIFYFILINRYLLRNLVISMCFKE